MMRQIFAHRQACVSNARADLIPCGRTVPTSRACQLRSPSHTSSAVHKPVTGKQCDPNGSGYPWKVRVAQRWDAVRRLRQVSSVATTVFYVNDGFQPFVNFSKIIYTSELFIRLGWRVTRLNSTSCFVIAQPPAPTHSCKGLAGVLEMSIQSDILPMCCGNSRQAAVITTMAVLPEVQRQGIGTALLEAAQCWAASLGVQVIALFVYRDNYSAISLYERVGFERVAGWVDPQWLECAEKGMIGPTRRVLYVRQLLGTVT